MICVDLVSQEGDGGLERGLVVVEHVQRGVVSALGGEQ